MSKYFSLFIIFLGLSSHAALQHGFVTQFKERAQTFFSNTTFYPGTPSKQRDVHEIFPNLTLNRPFCRYDRSILNQKFKQNAGRDKVKKIPFLNDLGRKLSVGMLAALNSEVLFSNLTPSIFFGKEFPAMFLVYFPPFFLMDEIIQRYNLSNSDIFYLGSIFGLVLEGFYLATIPEAPVFFTTYVTTFWHGLITTWLTFNIIENFFPRRPYRAFNRKMVMYSTISTALVGSVFLIASSPIIVANIFTYTGVVGLGAGFTWLIHRNIKKEKKYKHRPWMGLFTLALAYGLGELHQLEEAEIEEEYTPYDLSERRMRGGMYSALGSTIVIKLISIRF